MANMPPLPQGYFWDQFEGSFAASFSPGLVFLIAFDAEKRAIPIGTGFVFAVFDGHAAACTAAHNFKGIEHVQNPRPRHHASALPEFLPKPQALDLNGKSIRGAVVNGNRTEMATLDWVVTDQSRDVAFFALTADDPNDATAFSKSFVLASTTPDVGGEIAVLGYRAETPRQANGHYSMAMLLVLRRGLVVHRHERHVYCQRECIEASIPTLSGMSGGPVFAIPANGQPIRPFGFVSHDLDDGQIQDRTKPGTLIVPVLGTEVKTLADGSEQAVISMLRDNIRRLDEGATTGGPFPPPPRLDE